VFHGWRKKTIVRKKWLMGKRPAEGESTKRDRGRKIEGVMAAKGKRESKKASL